MVSEEEEYRIVLNAARVGNENAKTKLAWYMLSGRGGAAVDERGAVAILEEQVQKEDTDAMWMLGVCSEFGKGTEQNIDRAEMFYCQSRDGKNDIGGILVENGKKNARGNGCLDVGRL